MPNIAGFANPIGLKPTFLVPLFRDHSGSNRFLIQRISSSDKIAAFELFDDLRGFETPEVYQINRIAIIGESALWAFAFGQGEIILGTAKELRSVLEPRIRAGELRDFPLLETEAAEFCGLIEIRERALSAAFEWLGGPSSLSAAVWRDVVILWPAACRDLAALAKREGIELNVAELSVIQVESAGEVAQVRLPPNLGEKLKRPSVKDFPNTQKLTAIFNLRLLVTFNSTAAKWPLAATKSYKTLSYPWAFLSGPGIHYPNALPPEGRQAIKIGPFGTINRNILLDERDAWSRGFFVFRNSQSMLEDVRNHRSLWDHGGAKIGIVVQRTGFGSPQNSTVKVSDIISNLTKDARLPSPSPMIFFVGGHVLQRPLGFAPDSVASLQGAALARSAASAVMALAYSKGAISPKEVFSSVGRPSLGLALRHALARDERPTDALRQILYRLLHPELLIHKSQNISLVISPALWSVRAELIDELIDYTHVEERKVHILELPIRGGRPQISLVASGVFFGPPSLSSFIQFCQNLLEAIGWLLNSRSLELFPIKVTR